MSADAVLAHINPVQRIVDLHQAVTDVVAKRGQLLAFECDGGAFRVVFVVEVAPGGSSHDLAQFAR